MAEEWGPWIEHDGKGCPFLPGVRVMLRHEDAKGHIMQYPAKIVDQLDHPDWDHENFGRICVWRGIRGLAGRVLAYRIRRPDALRRLIDLAADPNLGLPRRFPIEELV